MLILQEIIFSDTIVSTKYIMYVYRFGALTGACFITYMQVQVLLKNVLYESSLDFSSN